MPATYEPIATQTLGTATADVFFNSIPQTYTDLVLVINGNTATQTNCGMRFNSDNTNNYSTTYYYGDGSTVNNGRGSNMTYLAGGDFISTGNCTNVFHIFNYTNATTFKTVLNRTTTSGLTMAWVSIWRKAPAAITAINVLTATGANYSIGTSFTLYGIKAA